MEFTWKWFDNVAHTSVDLKTTKKFGSKYIGNYTKTRVVSMNRFYFDGFLVVKDVTKEDEGKYTCIVKSSHGTDEMAFYLHVRGKGKGENTWFTYPTETLWRVLCPQYSLCRALGPLSSTTCALFLFISTFVLASKCNWLAGKSC